MRNIFQRDMNEKELDLYNESIKLIKSRNSEIINEIDKIIKTKSIDRRHSLTNLIMNTFFLNESNLDIDGKICYLSKLKSKIQKMDMCDLIKVRVAKPWHPMCWCFHLSKIFPKNEFFKNYIMFGFSVPFYPSKPIMIAHYVFEKGFTEVNDILSHELTHSLLNTKDLNAENYKDALNDAWTIGLLYM